MTVGTEPALSAVVVTADRFSSIRRTVEHLRAQTVANQVELVIVRDRSASLVDAAPEELLGFNRVTVVETGPIGNVDKAAAPGMRAASGPVVAVLEDHAYPEPGWAETMIRAHRDGGWAATCSEYVNANPASPLSWANLLWAYGAWTRPARDGEAPGIARHNVAFSRDALAPLADELEDLLGRGGGLEARLREAGGRLGVVSSTHVAHINPSRLRSTIQLRFSAGRLRTGPAGARASMKAKGPMLVRVPAGALRRLASTARRAHKAGVLPNALPGLLLATLLDAAGETVGVLAGPGHTAVTTAAFEFDRMRHVTASDRRALGEARTPAGVP